MERYKGKAVDVIVLGSTMDNLKVMFLSGCYRLTFGFGCILRSLGHPHSVTTRPPIVVLDHYLSYLEQTLRPSGQLVLVYCC